MMSFLIRTTLVLCAVLHLHAEQYVVTLRTADVPSALLAYRPQSLTARFDTAIKRSDRVQTREQRAALDALSRYRIIDLNDPGSVDRIRSMQGVADVRPLARYQLHVAPEDALTNDSLVSDQYALARLGAGAAWKIATGRGVVVGVLDTGIDWLHEDLIGALAVTAAEDINGNGRFDDWPGSVEIDGVTGDLNDVDDDANGVVDDVIGYDFVDQAVRNLGDDRDRDPIPFDEQGHGTSVGGVISATANNRIGIAGLAHGARLRALRAFDATGNAEEDDIASALIYAALTGIDVVNMSFGDGVDSPMFRDAVAFAASMNVVLVASSGNTGAISRQYPAGYDDVIAVGSTNSDDRRSPFSSTGSLVAVTAPGEGIVTTAVNSRYRRVNGTSFAAPYVAAVAAMLRERFPAMSAQEIRATMQASSLDLGAPGWDPAFGAGRLRADVALAQVGSSDLHVTSPINEQLIDRRSSTTLRVVGTVNMVNQTMSHVYVGRGLDPQEWTHVIMLPKALRNATLATIPLDSLTDGLYTVRVQVVADDGRTHEIRRRVTVVGGDCEITSLEVLSAWKTDRRVPVVTLRATQPSSTMITMLPDGGDSTVFSDVRRHVRLHSVVLPELPARDSLGSVTVSCSSGIGAVVDTTLRYRLSTDAAPQTGWRTTQVVPWSGYVLNDVRDVYRDGTKTVFMADLTGNSFGGIRTMSFDGANWRVRDSLQATWIPRGVSDVNGNGLYEVFCHVIGKAVLFEQSTPAGSPFARVLFADTLSGRQAAGVADIDGDGREELLMLSDSGCTVVTYRNNQFDVLGRIVNVSEPASGASSNRVDEISIATGDFSGTGRKAVAFADTDGDLVISTWNGATFTQPVVIANEGAGGSGYVAAGDVDGDGRDEIVYGVPDSTQANADREYGRQLWTYRMVRGSDSGYRVVWTEHIEGVRYGIGFRNGLAVGNLDDNAGAEIAICAYPRLYVFGQRNGVVTPLWYQPDVVTPRMLIHDFNGNGVNEIGVGTTVPMIGAMTGFRFSEINVSALEVPRALRAHRREPVGVDLDWMPVQSASAYVVDGQSGDGVLLLRDTVGAERLTHVDVPRAGSIRYVVRALFASGQMSTPSLPADVVLGPRVQVASMSPDTLLRSQLRTGVQLELTFTGDIALHHIEPSALVLSDTAARRAVRATSITAGDARRAIVTFPAFDAEQRCVVLIGGLYDKTTLAVEDTSIARVVLEDPAAREDIIIAALRVESPTSLVVEFSQDVDASAEDASNYDLQPVGSVSAVLLRSATEAVLSLDPSVPLTPRGVPYVLTVANVTGVSGAAMTTGAGRTRAFTIRAEDLASAYVYPHPVKLQAHDVVTFAGLTASARIVVLDAMMRPVAELTTRDRSGGVQWDLTRSSGERVSPGLYFYRVEDASDGAQPVLRKLMIER
jgi:subtilisin family serine protease